MATIRQLLASKGYEVWSTGPEDTVYDALKLMAEKNIGALLVLDSGKIVGIVSERDYARKVILKGKASAKTPVSEIMTSDLVTVEPQMSVKKALSLMTDRHIRHLPVLEEGQLAGIVSIGDLVKTIIAEQELFISQLESYIAGM
jgi:CBS domain-containing protein